MKRTRYIAMTNTIDGGTYTAVPEYRTGYATKIDGVPVHVENRAIWDFEPRWAVTHDGTGRRLGDYARTRREAIANAAADIARCWAAAVEDGTIKRNEYATQRAIAYWATYGHGMPARDFVELLKPER